MIKITSPKNSDCDVFNVDMTGEIKHIAKEFSYAIAGTYKALKKNNKEYAETFRMELIKALGHGVTSVWNDMPGSGLRCRALVIHEGEKLNGDDIANLLRSGVPTDIIKELLNQM
ncbi:MAG: hypothetical protein ACLUT5_07370 [Butyricicoccus sp.]